MVRVEGARKLGKAGGLIILVASIILFLYCEASGWGFQHPLAVGEFITFVFVGALIAVAASSRYGYPGPEEAARRAALAGCKVADEVKAKYAQSLSIATLLWLVLLPTYVVFFALYTYFIVEPAGAPQSVAAYATVGEAMPIVSIFLFVYYACFYLRGHELRQFMRSIGKGSRMKRR